MKTLTGVAASPGTAVAPAYVYRPGAYTLPSEPATDVDKAIGEVAIVLDSVGSDLDEAARQASGAASDILKAQAAMARDPALRDRTGEEIRSGTPTARAVLAAGERFAAELEETGNAYLAARGPDVRHICDLAARMLADAPPRTPPRPTTPCILVAEDLTPSDTTGLDPRLVRAIATSQGSTSSHTTVVARGLGIPAVVGIGGLLDEVAEGDTVGVDGATGNVIVSPSPSVIEELRATGEAEQVRKAVLRKAAGTGPTATADGHLVEVAANVRSLKEVGAALAAGAEAIGLLRTELLYIGRNRPPMEEEQVALLREIHRELAGRRLVVRTFDIGSDKPARFLPARPEHNPELGVRGIRLAREHPDLIRTQLRAVARVADLGPTAVMAPMVATADEARWFVQQARAAGVPASVEVGVMAEVPSLAITASEIAPEIAFFSIGTNDLTQYLFAADRRHPGLAALQDRFQPALLRAVAAICRGAGDRWVGVCGEAASDPAWALLAVGLGVTELSMQAIAIAEVRVALRATRLDRCREAAERALQARDVEDVRAIAYGLLEEAS